MSKQDEEIKIIQLKKNILKAEQEIDEFKDKQQHSFEWRFEFPEVLDEEGNFMGFDIVISNPPYIIINKNKSVFAYLNKHPIYHGSMDLWYLFGWLGLELTNKKNGYVGYIAPNNWNTNDGSANFRNYFLDKGKLIVI